MSQLERLIDEKAPNGVPFKALQDVANYATGTQLNRSTLSNAGPYPVINGGVAQSGYYDDWNTEGNVVTVSQGGASAGYVAWAPTAFWAGAHCYVVRPTDDRVLPRFLYFVLKSQQNAIQDLAQGAGIPGLSRPRLGTVQIPIPPLEVQRNIIELLDHFTELEAELEAELQARRRQFAHYRDELVNVRKAGVRRIPMRELGQFIRGRRFVKADIVADGIPSIHYGEIYTHYGTSTSNTISHVRQDLADRLRYAKTGDVVIASVGETVEDVAKAVAWLGKSDVAIHDDSFAFRSEADPTYIAYVMQTADFHAQKEKYVTRAKNNRVGSEGLGRIVVPVPSLGEQRQIVSLLDAFDALVNSISDGLPAELTARRKQYEYYRDKLLTFEKALG